MPAAPPEPPKVIAQGRYETFKLLGEGCFGMVYSGEEVSTQKKVAVKYELKSPHTQGCLALEADMLNMIVGKNGATQQGFAQCFFIGREGNYTCMVMDLLGKSLEDTVEAQGGKLNVKTVCLASEQIIYRIEYLHSRGILHRDIKPENFMWGLDRTVHHIHLIDFGLSLRYWSNRHLDMNHSNTLTGTARYASINSQKGHTQSRRDDVEAIGHMILYCLRGSLPWSGLKVKTDAERAQKIREKKESVPLAELCAGFPTEFQTYLAYCRNLPFKQRPDYVYLRSLFRDVREKVGPLEDYDLQWLNAKDIDVENLLPVDCYSQSLRAKGFVQPDDDSGDDSDAAPVKSGCCGFGKRRTVPRPKAGGKVADIKMDTE
jgi:serine/threonine protein kinase